MITAIDYDHDGLKDVLVGSDQLSELFLWRNNERGILQLESLTDSLLGTLSLHTLDINQDDLDDFIIVTSTLAGSNIWLCTCLGGENYSWTSLGLAPNSGIKNLQYDDFDGDGDFDIIYDENIPCHVLWMINNNGNNTFTQTSLSFDEDIVTLFGRGDSDADGDKDILIGKENIGSSQNRILVLENIGNWEFTLHEIITLNYSVEGSFENFIGDAMPDILIFIEDNATYYCYVNNGGFNFSLEITGDNWIKSMFHLGPIVDRDDDGYMEFVLESNNSSQLINLNDNSQLYFNTSYPIESFNDFNLDGALDILLTNADVMISSGSGFTSLNGYYCAQHVPETFNSGKNSNADILLYGYGSSIVLFEQDFDEKILYPQSLGTSIEGVRPFDKENDGDTDIFWFGPYYIGWLINDSGTYTSDTIAGNVHTSNVWIGDLDSDNQIDILYFDNHLKRMELNGDIYITTDYLEVNNSAFNVMDIDSDGDLDVIYFYKTPDGQQLQVRSLLNNQGVFTNILLTQIESYLTIMQTALDTPHILEVVDLDMDGMSDLVFMPENGSYLSYLRNYGNNSFIPYLINDEENNITSFDFGDFDMDEYIDIAVYYAWDTEIRILRNTGSGNFSLENTGINLGRPYKLASADMDNDGDIDIVFSNINFGLRVGWLKNLTFDCPRTYSSETVTICSYDSAQFASQWLHNAGMYSDTLSSSTGCDSVQVLFLNHTSNPNYLITQSQNQLIGPFGIGPYSWYRNDTLIVANSPYHTVYANQFGIGIYTVVITDSLGCNWASVPYHYDAIINIEDKRINFNKIYPNPAEHDLLIESSNNEVLEIKFINAQGQAVLIEYPNKKQHQISVSEYPRGIYVVEIRTNFSIERQLIVLN